MPKRKNINKYMNIASNKAGIADLFITGDIVDDAWWDDEVSPKTILDSLEKLEDVKTIDMYICSMGGSVVAGNSIHSLLNTYKKKNDVTINAYISTAMSMATGIAMVADNVYIYENAVFMVHKPSSMAWGNADDMRKEAEILDVFEEGLISNYMARFKGSKEELQELLAKESWLTAQEAVGYGFADKVIEPLEMVASGKGIKVNDVLFERKEIVDILKTKIENKQESEGTMKYDEVLMDYGISEETFNAFDNVADLMTIIKAKNDAEKEAEIQEAVEEVKAGIAITKEEVAEKLETEEITADEIIDLAIIGKNIDAKMQEKLAKYEDVVKERDLMRADVVKSTLESGVRAMGAENFSNSVWEKALNSMNYEDVKVMRNDWDKKGKEALNAGVRQSVVKQSYKNELDGNKNYNV